MDEGIRQDLTEAALGSRSASNRLWMSVYSELRRLAHGKLGGERPDHTLSTTALVHEAYLKLVPGDWASGSDRRHFMAVAARAMRQILVDYARGRARLKRGGGRAALTFDESTYISVDPVTEPDLFIALDGALTKLEREKERLGTVVELKFFGGMTSSEISELLGVSERTVERDWQRARAYLYRLLTSLDDAGP